MSEIAIHVENLSKSYNITHQAASRRYKTLRDDLVMLPRWLGEMVRGQNGSRETFWALKDVSFDVYEGEVVGIIGRNGAGKSTLLKILSRITEPTGGRAEIYGRVGSLLEVGTGFHPELTGRENIYLSGAVLGMTHSEVQRKFDEIVAFAESEKFLDTPAKHYSSGMYVRLAFAVAAHLEPEILVIDEVLAVGDLEFQNKCLGKMDQVSKSGRTVLFVSHNMGAISSLTENCLYIKQGRIAAYGGTRSVVEQYLVEAASYAESGAVDLDYYRRDRQVESPVRVTRISLNGLTDKLPSLEMGATFSISIELQVLQEIQGANLTVTIKNAQGHSAALLFSWDQNFSLNVKPGRYVAEVAVEHLPLTPGQYFADIGINQSTNTIAYEVILNYPLLRAENRGQVTYWLERPWGDVHWNNVVWTLTRV